MIEEVKLDDFEINENWELFNKKTKESFKVFNLEDEWISNNKKSKKIKVTKNKKKTVAEIDLKDFEKENLEEDIVEKSIEEEINELEQDIEVKSHISELFKNKSINQDSFKSENVEVFFWLNKTIWEESFIKFIKEQENDNKKCLTVLATYIRNNIERYFVKNWNDLDFLNLTNEELVIVIKKELRKPVLEQNKEFIDFSLSVLLYKNLRFINFFLKKEFKDFWYIEWTWEDLFQLLCTIFIFSIQFYDETRDIKFVTFCYFQLFRWIRIINNTYYVWMKETSNDKRKFWKMLDLLNIAYWDLVNETWEIIIYEDVVNDNNFLNLVFESWIPKKSILDWTLHKAITQFNWYSCNWIKNNFLVSEWSWNELFYDSEDLVVAEEFDYSNIRKEFAYKVVKQMLNSLTIRELVLVSIRFWFVEDYFQEIIEIIEKMKWTKRIEQLEKKVKELELKLSILLKEKEEIWTSQDKNSLRRKKELISKIYDLRLKLKDLNLDLNALLKSEKANYEFEAHLRNVKLMIEEATKKWEKLSYYWTLEFVWKVFWCTRERIRQIESKILSKLRETKRKELLTDRAKKEKWFFKDNWFTYDNIDDVLNYEFSKISELSDKLLEEFVNSI